MQHAILEVRWGPQGGVKAVLAPGDTLRVGCRPRADLVVQDDTMSGEHFELSWDGARCALRDLDSAGGTLLGGRRVSSAEVGNRGWIRAGQTDFMVYLEASTPPSIDDERYLDDAAEDEVEPAAALWLRDNREPRRLAREARDARAEAALTSLAAVAAEPGGHLYAVLDAARSDRILVLLRESVERARSLYEGVDGESLEHVAPHLVELPAGSALLARLLREGWERRWGIFLACPRGFREVRRHLRRFLMVADADTRERSYFRFYDPVVLGAFLPVTTRRQRAELFGEIRSLFLEDEAGNLARLDAEAEVP